MPSILRQQRLAPLDVSPGNTSYIAVLLLLRALLKMMMMMMMISDCDRTDHHKWQLRRQEAAVQTRHQRSLQSACQSGL